jgi:signal transduction histidine kinase
VNTLRARILVVDDSAVAVASIRSALADEGHEVHVEHDGEAALAALAKRSYDVLITDWLMPRLDGRALCRAIRSRPELADLYVIFLTVQDTKNQIVEGLLAGADDYVAKPFHPAELRARVRAGLRIVDAQKQRAELARMKEEFVAMVSHELRTPLTSILGYLEMVRDDGSMLSLEQRDFLDILERNAQRLLRLVGDLLFFAQVESRKLALEVGEVELASVVDECVEAQQPAADEKQVTLAVDVDSLPPLRADRSRLVQLLDNLVANAIKFTPAEGRVDVRLARANGSAVIEVADTGIGIPRDEQDRVFQRFFRTSNATAKAIPGTGLGLSIVKAIAEAHGGTASVSSAVGRGTTFRVALPL